MYQINTWEPYGRYLGTIWETSVFGMVLGISILGGSLGHIPFWEVHGNQYGTRLGNQGFWDLLGGQLWDAVGILYSWEGFGTHLSREQLGTHRFWEVDGN
eukprot:jgi/Botrbrau1/9081/Bobra.178_2s0013.1